MSQIVDIGPWLSRSEPAPQPEAVDADIAASLPIPPLPPERRRRPLPHGRDLYIRVTDQHPA